MGFSNKEEILIRNLHDSAWNLLRDFFNDTSDTACELTVDFVHICYIQCVLFDCCIFNHGIMPATLADAFLLIL